MRGTQHFDGYAWIDLKACQAAIECADLVFARIKQDPIDVAQIAESMRADGVTIEDLLAQLEREDAMVTADL